MTVFDKDAKEVKFQMNDYYKKSIYTITNFPQKMSSFIEVKKICAEDDTSEVQVVITFPLTKYVKRMQEMNALVSKTCLYEQFCKWKVIYVRQFAYMAPYEYLKFAYKYLFPDSGCSFSSLDNAHLRLDRQVLSSDADDDAVDAPVVPVGRSSSVLPTDETANNVSVISVSPFAAAAAAAAAI